jgi:hypothetical protein
MEMNGDVTIQCIVNGILVIEHALSLVNLISGILIAGLFLVKAVVGMLMDVLGIAILKSVKAVQANMEFNVKISLIQLCAIK